MKISFWPKSKAGKWSLGCFMVTVVMMVIFYSILAIFNVKGGDTFFSNPELFIPILTAWASGAAAFILGIIAMFKSKSKSILIFIVTVISFLTTLYGVLEIAFPH